MTRGVGRALRTHSRFSHHRVQHVGVGMQKPSRVESTGDLVVEVAATAEVGKGLFEVEGFELLLPRKGADADAPARRVILSVGLAQNIGQVSLPETGPQGVVQTPAT
jgi:hypothetical protein